MPAPAPKGGAGPLKSPGVAERVERAIPVSHLQFSQAIRVPGKGGAFTRISTTAPLIAGVSDSLHAESIYEYNGRFCIDGTFWIPVTCGALVGWQY